MSTVNIRTAQNVYIEYEMASLGHRILAYLVDRAIIAAYVIAVSGIVASIFGSLPNTALFWVPVLLPVLLYDLLSEYFLDGRSLGKIFYHLKVMPVGGGQTPVSAYLLRWLLRPLDFMLVSQAVAVVSIAVTPKGQRLGDLAAGTCLVSVRPDYKKARRELPLASGAEQQVVFRQVGVLTDKEIGLVEEVLRGQGHDGPAVAALAAQLRKVLNIQNPGMADYQFLKQVATDYRLQTSK